ncbi:MFS general substrate transporter [Aspergillus heteromorphus CBS 117.55]|uniref:MFS general substrate transporter n=1 Tax=Aspergillus heteromorphus CBS 117.55 TaxID=1448321 RepID=A0A317V0R9_9EURO|nr:MFS general substrate transporter [Aspergillus heteromorphus CBS 117.55]PWY67924.1 MFS general substrate transporter [Aspergillus heteromorphus CBS 117.55]
MSCQEIKAGGGVTSSVFEPSSDSEKDAIGPQDASSVEISPPKSLPFKLTMLFLSIVTLVASMDAVIVGSSLAAIAEDLETTSVEAFWVGTAFLLAQTVTIPFYGATSEIFGRKPAILAALSVFTFGSIMCATARNGTWLIGARVVQGVGAGGMLQLVQLIMSDITTMSERGLYMGFMALSWAFGTNIAIPMGGAISSRTTWRWIFWINVPTCVLCIIGLVSFLHLHRAVSASFMVKLATMDWTGLIIFTCGTTLFLVGLTSGGISHPWKSAAVLVPLVLGFCLLVAFVLTQWRVSRRPIMPLRIFHDRSAIVGYTTSFLHGLVFWAVAYYMIIFYLGALQHGILHAACETMTSIAYAAPAGFVSSMVIKRTQRFKYIIVTGWGLLAAGLGTNVTMHPNSSPAMLYAPRVLASLGGGLLFPTPLFAVQARQKDQNIGIATSVQVFMRSLGAAFGVGLGGAIFQNQWTREIHRSVSAGNIPHDLVIQSNVAEMAYTMIKAFPRSVQDEYRWVYARSLATVWWVMMGLSLVGFAISFVARNDVVKGGLSGSQNFRDTIDYLSEVST